jgi:hypothetical protein
VGIHDKKEEGLLQAVLVGISETSGSYGLSVFPKTFVFYPEFAFPDMNWAPN